MHRAASEKPQESFDLAGHLNALREWRAHTVAWEQMGSMQRLQSVKSSAWQKQPQDRLNRVIMTVDESRDVIWKSNLQALFTDPYDPTHGVVDQAGRIMSAEEWTRERSGVWDPYFGTPQAQRYYQDYRSRIDSRYAPAYQVHGRGASQAFQREELGRMQRMHACMHITVAVNEVVEDVRIAAHRPEELRRQEDVKFEYLFSHAYTALRQGALTGDDRALFTTALSDFLTRNPDDKTLDRYASYIMQHPAERTHGGEDAVANTVLDSITGRLGRVPQERDDALRNARTKPEMDAIRTRATETTEKYTDLTHRIALHYLIALLEEISIEQHRGEQLANQDIIAHALQTLNRVIRQSYPAFTEEITLENLSRILEALQMSASTVTPTEAVHPSGVADIDGIIRELQAVTLQQDGRSKVAHAVGHPVVAPTAQDWVAGVAEDANLAHAQMSSALIRATPHMRRAGASVAEWGSDLAADARLARTQVGEAMRVAAPQVRRAGEHIVGFAGKHRGKIATGVAVTAAAAGVYFARDTISTTARDVWQTAGDLYRPAAADVMAPTRDVAVLPTSAPIVGRISPEVYRATTVLQTAHGAPVIHPDIRRPSWAKAPHEAITLSATPTKRQFIEYALKSLAAVRADLALDLKKIQEYQGTTSLDDAARMHRDHLLLRYGLTMPEHATPEQTQATWNTLASRISGELSIMNDKTAPARMMAYWAQKTGWGTQMTGNNLDGSHVVLASDIAQQYADIITKQAILDPTSKQYVLTYADGAEAMHDAVSHIVQHPAFLHAITTTLTPEQHATRLGRATERAVNTILSESGDVKAYAATLKDVSTLVKSINTPTSSKKKK